MNNNNQTTTVIITGATSGIGLGLVRAYAARGFNIVGNARSADRLAAVGASLPRPDTFLGVPGDIGATATATTMVEQTLDRFGRIDTLINNAGVFMVKPFTDFTAADIDTLFSTNLRGVFQLTQAVVPHLVAQESGRIVNIGASIAEQPLHEVPAAVPIAFKGALHHFTRALALELAPHRVTVNAVAPGVIDTPMYQPETHEFLAGLHPLGRMGTVDEVVAAVLHLTSAAFNTGTILNVDGGMTAGRW